MKLQRWGALASIFLAVTFIAPALVYLMGNLRDALGPLGYGLADFMYGPVWAASLVVVFLALKERIGESAPRRMSLALAVSIAAAAAFVLVACIRSANRQYHLHHPELHLEGSTTVLIVWTTLVAGVIGAAWHMLGWAWLLLGWAGWTSRRLPRVLSALYGVAGAVALFVYLVPEQEGFVILLGAILSIWLGIVLWIRQPAETSV
jgi:hypothetical protein